MGKLKKYHALLAWYAPVLLVQVLSSRVTLANIRPWYDTLEKAPWNPPGWVFGPVWTLLYFSMAVAVWMVHQTSEKGRSKGLAYAWFFAQLLANGAWSFLFFGHQLVGWALLDLAILNLLILGTVRAFYGVRPVAGYSLIPYGLWSLYALTLNAAIWWLN